MNPEKQVVDARNLLCPMPVIRVQDRVAGLAAGTLVEAVCTDPGALIDIPSWCRINGHRVLETRSEDNLHIVLLRVGEG
jgi:TusA-related sulfurtransferase